jgi:hypothetical protein
MCNYRFPQKALVAPANFFAVSETAEYGGRFLCLCRPFSRGLQRSALLADSIIFSAPLRNRNRLDRAGGVAVLDGFGKVLAQYFRASFQVGNGAGYF